MMTVSLCMIVRDEEQTIARCLQSVAHLVDEIVIVDTGSSDGTKAVCRRFTDRLFDFPWIDDFSAARNFSFSRATKDFILWLDADDIMSDADQKKFMDLKKSLSPDVNAVSMKYELSFNARGEATYSMRRYRLVRRKAGFRWHGAVHEYLEVEGRVAHSDVAVQHRPIERDPDRSERDRRRNLKIYERMLADGRPFSPRDLYYYANELKDHARYEEAVEYYGKFFATGEGWVEDLIGACAKVSECYKQMGDETLELEWALRSLRYDHPRPEGCCRIGDVFMRRGDYSTAVFWYNTAIKGAPVKPKGVAMFEHGAYSTWFPHLQLCLCYYRMGSPWLAYFHNEQAAKYLDDDERIARNRDFLAPLAEKHRAELRAKLAAGSDLEPAGT